MASVLRTTPDDFASTSSERSTIGLMKGLACTLLVFASFLSYSLLRSPIPGVNEPHYLAKSKHFWNSEWCRGDLFLDSSNPHAVFYATVGSLTQWLTLEQTALIGRVIAIALLAIGWVAMVRKLTFGWAAVVWTAWIYLYLAAMGSFSGEWIVGGVESKVFAYGFVFLAIAAALGNQLILAAVWSGFAVSFHPVVGVWSIVAAAIGYVLRRIFFNVHDSDDDRRAVSAPVLFIAAVVFIVCALPGLVPALQSMESGSPEADRIQVLERLAHHLNPLSFSRNQFIYFAVILAAWLVARYFAVLPEGERRFAAYVVGSILITLAGLIVGAGLLMPDNAALNGLSVKLLKFYPFRLADAFLPIAASIAIVGVATRAIGDSADNFDWRIAGLASVAAAALFVAALVLPNVDRNASRMTDTRLAKWLDVCRWIANETDQQVSVLTPPSSWAFKWYAERPEYFSYKDCPQDGPALLEWRRRYQLLQPWRTRNAWMVLTASELANLAQQEGVTHVIAEGRRLPLTPIYSNGEFLVYSLAELSKPRPASAQ